MKKLLLIAIVVLGFTAASFGQNGNSVTISDNTAGGEIITPITLTRINNMEFGTITAAAGGTVTLNPGAAATYTNAVAFTGTNQTLPTTLSFNVTGDAENTYSIAVSGLPTVVTHTDATTTMGIGTWTSNKGISFVGAGGTGTGALTGLGADSFEIGATLTLTAGASQKSGRYTSAAFSVTVAYN